MNAKIGVFKVTVENTVNMASIRRNDSSYMAVIIHFRLKLKIILQNFPFLNDHQIPWFHQNHRTSSIISQVVLSVVVKK